MRKLLFLIILFFNNIIYAVHLENISIIIPSCDKYAELWQPFFTLLFKQWPSLEKGKQHANIPIVFISNKKTFTHPRVNNIQFPKEISWSDNLITVLATIKTKYILYLQEDYFITEPINIKLLAKTLKYIEKYNACYVSLVSMGQDVKNKKIILNSPNLAEISQHSPYRTSLQAAIWETKIFHKLLKTKENIWSFELAGSIRSETLQQPFLAHVSSNLQTTYDVINYINAVDRGTLLTSALNYLNAQNIKFNQESTLLYLESDNKFTKLKKKIILKISHYINLI